MDISKGFSLKSYNTFGMDVQARYYSKVVTIEQIRVLLESEIARKNDILVLGGGSNLLFTSDFNGLVIQPGINFIKETGSNKHSVVIEVGAGTPWNDFVSYCVEHNYWGVENLVSIPGFTGAAPIQNIGAYGVEQESVFESCRVLDFSQSDKEYVFLHADCKFGYRDSIFKQMKKGFIITSVTYRLSKTPRPVLKYQGLHEYLDNKGISEPGIKDIAQSIAAIRASKLPDTSVTGNAGSFFKNPVVEKRVVVRLKYSYPDLVFYEDGNNYKVPAAWLIEKAGWKGQREGNAGVHDQQALVIVNHGGARGSDITRLSDKIISSVYDMFGIRLVPEVNIL